MIAQHNLNGSRRVIVTLVASAIALASALPATASAQTLNRDAVGTIEFRPPRDGAPRTTFGGGTRGNLRFFPPVSSAPRRTSGGGTRGDNLEVFRPGEVQFRPRRNGAPQRTVGSGIRGEGQIGFVPLLPETNSGHTISPRPTLYLYVPPLSARQVFFSIQDENFKPLYQTYLDISGESGIVSVTLPESAPELEVGREYIWFFAPIGADGILLPDNAMANGWIKRVAPATSDRTPAATPVEQAQFYAREGLWYDTLFELARAKQGQPESAIAAREWKTLLKQVGLERVADRAITERL